MEYRNISEKVGCWKLPFCFNFILWCFSAGSNFLWICAVFVNKYLKIINQMSRIPNTYCLICQFWGIQSWLSLVGLGTVYTCANGFFFSVHCYKEMLLARRMCQGLANPWWLLAFPDETLNHLAPVSWDHNLPSSFPFFCLSLPFLFLRKILTLGSSSPDHATSNACAQLDAWICLAVLHLGSASWLLITPVSFALCLVRGLHGNSPKFRPVPSARLPAFHTSPSWATLHQICIILMGRAWMVWFILFTLDVM